MSPDPPREDSGEDTNRIRRFSGEFMEGVLNDDEFFIVPDAPYELDMEQESDYSDSDEEGGASNAPGRATVTVVEGGEEIVISEGQARGRYRLLIPFTSVAPEEAPVVSASTTEISADSRETTGEQQKSSGDESGSEGGVATSSGENDKPSTSGCTDAQKREIEMTDEKVEKIKEVMKNITLPSNAIPKWAAEIDEDSWKKKLNESIGTSKVGCKTVQSQSSDKS